MNAATRVRYFRGAAQASREAADATRRLAVEQFLSALSDPRRASVYLQTSAALFRAAASSAHDAAQHLQLIDELRHPGEMPGSHSHPSGATCPGKWSSVRSTGGRHIGWHCQCGEVRCVPQRGAQSIGGAAQ